MSRFSYLGLCLCHLFLLLVLLITPTTPIVWQYSLGELFAEPRVGKAGAGKLKEDSRSHRHIYSLQATAKRGLLRWGLYTQARANMACGQVGTTWYTGTVLLSELSYYITIIYKCGERPWGQRAWTTPSWLICSLPAPLLPPVTG